MSPTTMFVLAGISGTVFILISLYWIYDSFVGERIDLYYLIEDVLEMMEIAGIDYNKDLYTEVYFYVKHINPKFRYRGRSVKESILLLKEVQTKLWIQNYNNVQEDIDFALRVLERYYRKQERLGKL